jgi:hypothetical protein
LTLAVKLCANTEKRKWATAERAYGLFIDSPHGIIYNERKSVSAPVCWTGIEKMLTVMKLK